MRKKSKIKINNELYLPILLWKILRPILVIFAAVLITFGIYGTAFKKIKQKFYDAVDPNDTSIIEYEVSKGATLSSVSKDLQKLGIVNNNHIFKYYSDIKGLGKKIQVGTYTLSKNMNISEIANVLSLGTKPSNTRKITIIPGQTIDDIAKNIFTESNDQNMFLNLCKDGSDFRYYFFIEDIFNSQNIDKRKYLLEGYLAPNTYEIYNNSHPKDVIEKILSQTNKLYTSEYESQAEYWKMSMDEIITLASIIEKEAGKNDFKKVSAVFHNRLKKNMKLESDVTVHYNSEIKRMKLTKEDISYDSPYNTYKNKGLPPGPICNPSSEAIYAALFPDENFIKEKYLYFCSKDPNENELEFSKTLKEHNEAVKKYSPLWEEYDKSRGL